MSDNPIIEFRKIDAETDLEEVHKEGMDRFEILQDRERWSRDASIEDKVFIETEGGGFADRNHFDSNGLTNDIDDDEPPPPRYQIDMVTPVLEQSLSDQRESEIQIQVRGVSESDKDTNTTMNGLIKNVEATSDAGYAYDNAFDETQKGGYGGWQIVTQYAGDSFDQEIFIRPIKDAASSLWFAPSELYTKEDALYAFVIWMIDLEEFKAQYPDAETTDFPSDVLTNLGLLDTGWFDTDSNMLRMAAYWRKRPIKRKIVQMTNGKVYDVDDDFNSILDELALQEITIARKPDGSEMRRKVDDYEVERFIMNGAEVLKGPQQWAGKYIPLVPEFGVQTVIEGREIVRGRVRKTKDAARLLNYAESAIVEEAALAPKSQLMMTPEQARGHERALERMNVSNDAVLFWNPDPDAPPPFRPEGRPAQNALIGIAQSMRENIAATLGANVGTQVDGTALDPRSGEAILQGQAVSEKGNNIYMTNHIRSVAYGGKILADLIPRIMSGQMQRRIIKPDGESQFVTVNQADIDRSTGQEVILNDLSAVKYDSTTDVGPQYASKRAQASAQIQALAEKNPAFANRPDLIVKGLDLGDGGELHDSLRRDMINNGQVEPTEEEREEFGLDQVQQIQQQLIPVLTEQLTNEANIRILNAQADQLESEAQSQQVNSQSKEMEAMAELLKQQSAAQSAQIRDITEGFNGLKTYMEALNLQAHLGIPAGLAEHDNRVSQNEVIEVVQQAVDPGPNTEQEADFQQVVDNLE